MATEELYRNCCDAVCECGWVKGIGLPGAFSVLEEHEFRSQNVAGTSAGAITVALIADAAPFVGGAGGGDKGFPYASLDYAQDAFTEAYGVEI